MSNRLFYCCLVLIIFTLSACGPVEVDSGSTQPGNPPPSETTYHPSNWLSNHGAEANANVTSCQSCHGVDFSGSGDADSCFSCHPAGIPFSTDGYHPADWISLHGSTAKQDTPEAESCKACHGNDFTGSGTAVSCFTCHTSGPPFTSGHPASWNGNPLNGHQNNFSPNSSPSERVNWMVCANAACHGDNLKGATGPTCQSLSCHGTGDGWPPVPHAMPYYLPSLHGMAARDATRSDLSMGNYCLICHGSPPNIFDGGFVSNTAIIGNPFGNCSGCHQEAKAHPTNWTRADNPSRSHAGISEITKDESCSLCHNTASIGAGPFTGAPSCFSPDFNGISCHPTGPGVAPHAVPYTDPTLHGPAAKNDLIYCQTCHGEPGGVGSNPRFNLPVGNLINGCEDCHPVGAAHPSGIDRWTFNIDPTYPSRRTHFASGNLATACALCHNLNGTGGSAPACTGCHNNSNPAVDPALNCSACHGVPPGGATPDQTGATLVDHLIGQDGDVSAVSLHENCSICHGASDNGSGRLHPKTSDYQLFNAANSSLNQGGDHLDGRIEMNGPSGVGAGYNQGTWSCDQACHSNTSPYVMSDSNLQVAFGNYESGSCDACHGYPPTTDGGPNDIHPPGATPVDHSGANILPAHEECNTCHGFSASNGRTDKTSSGGDLYLSSYHRDGRIELNGISEPNNNQNTDYQELDHGCANACHGNDAPHQMSDSALTVQLHEYGTGDCGSCHDAGVNGAPVITASSTHVDADGAGSIYAPGTCTDCHSGHTTGVLIPNNPDVGINYQNGGVYLGGAGTAVSGLITEAQICWACHDTVGVSEWNGKAYLGYSVNSSDWTQAVFNAPGNVIPDRPVTAIHSADNLNQAAWNSSVANNIDASGQIAVTTLETADQIRCSYCHDVHGTHGGPSTDGAPYLRGTWLPNPYDLERPPEITDNWPGNNWGQANVNGLVTVPRLLASASTNAPGGFVIDQNNSTPYPTQDMTLAQTAGVCTMCHGTDVDNMDFYPGSSLWVGTNGHSNSTLGGTGTNASNIFDARRDMTNGIHAGMHNQMANTAEWGLNPQPTLVPADYLPSSASFLGDGLPTRLTGWYGSARDANFTAWYSIDGIGTNGSITGRAHDFTCSKCHSPHATGLPALLITNCLDYQTPGNSPDGWTATMRNGGFAGNFKDIVVGPRATDSYARELGAGACHRNDSQNTGWIRLAPNQ